jgi:molecular chaperone DnaJ
MFYSQSSTHLNQKQFSQQHQRKLHKLAMSSKVDDNPYYKGLDAYQILNVPRSSDKATIKQAYRKLVATWHPDKFPNDVEKKKEGTLRMEKINRAYYCLEDEDRRRRYDTYGERGVGSSAASEQQLRDAGGPGFGGFGGGGSGIDMEGFEGGDISDIFDAFFGGGRGGGRSASSGFGGRSGGAAGGRSANQPMRGEDLEIEVEIPFMTSIFGGKETVKVRRLENCKTCTGSGLKPGAKIKQCSTCSGRGQVETIQRTPFGIFQSSSVCSNCRGSGQEFEEYCGTCRGKVSYIEYIELN